MLSLDNILGPNSTTFLTPLSQDFVSLILQMKGLKLVKFK